MKKVLFATTALVATASVAAADINLSGGGRFGIVYNSAGFTDANGNGRQDAAEVLVGKTRLEKRMTINIDGSGSTDAGLEFGGRIQLRSDEARGSAISGGNLFLGNDMFRITVGNTAGAAVNRLSYFAGGVGLTGLHWANVSYNIGNNRFNLNTYSNRGTAGGAINDVVRLDFNVGGFGVSISTDRVGTVNATAPAAVGGSESSIAASYNFGDWTVAAGYVDNFNNANGTVATPSLDMASISVNGSIGDFGVGAAYSDKDTIGSKAVVYGSYNFGDTNVTAFVASTSEDTVGSAGITQADVNGQTGSKTEFGIGFSHGLGGATLAGGISRNFRKDTQADLGISFNF